MPLPPSIFPRLGQLVRLLGSPHDGEIVGAAYAIRRTLAGVGADLNDFGTALENPPPPKIIYRDTPRAKADTSARRGTTGTRQQTISMLTSAIEDDVLTRWEKDFARSILAQMAKSSAELSDKQQAIVERIITKWQEAGVSS